MKLSTSILIGTTAAWVENDYKNHQFNCKLANGVQTCKWIKCKLFPKLKVTFKTWTEIDDPTDEILCPSLEESGCPTEWGVRYQVGKSNSKLYEQDTHDLVPPNGMKHNTKTGKLTITCLNSGAQEKAFCRPNYFKNETPAKVTFSWQSGSPPECAGPGESWAPWSSWSATNGQTCERTTATRSRKCLDGPHPGSAKNCSTKPEGPDSEVKTFWPKVCGKCHADLGMMYTPGQLNLPKIPLPSTINDHVEDKFDDGFVPVGQGIVKGRCHDQDEYTKPYNQKCKCDNDGCRFSNNPLCQGDNYKGYGHDYYWQPGAKDTFKADTTSTFTTVEVNDDFSITYTNPSVEPDERFANRISWWDMPNGEKGPSICRYWNKYSYVAGVERPMMNDDGSVDFDFYNWLECDTYMYKFPNVYDENFHFISNGAKYYEVLTSDNQLDWVTADKMTDDEIEDRMVVIGNAEGFNRKFYGLCRQTSCTVDTQLGGACHEKVVNLQSKAMIKNAPVYPGLLYWNKGNWKCQNLLVTAKLVESEDYSKFEVLVKA